MGKEYREILPDHAEFIKEQHLFFVGTAGREGHVNLSPKGHDAFRILTPNKVAYLDLTGSGNETSAHLLDTNRITFMFISFQGKPLILRLFGDGQVVLPGSEEWDELAGHFELLPGARQIIVSNIDIVKTSCGFSVPYYAYEGERSLLIEWANKKGEDGLKEYRKNKNARSMDGYPTPIGIELNGD
jgi:Pyridoxamine 5''-phosphate oxidase.